MGIPFLSATYRYQHQPPLRHQANDGDLQTVSEVGQPHVPRIAVGKGIEIAPPGHHRAARQVDELPPFPDGNLLHGQRLLQDRLRQRRPGPPQRRRLKVNRAGGVMGERADRGSVP